MVYFEDTGTLIAAPIDFVWKYLGSEQHGLAHARSARNFRVTKTVGPTSVIHAERFFEGRWSKLVVRSTDFPPFCVCNEEIEGTFAGTKFVMLYRPVGNQTQIDVFGDVQSKSLSPARAKRAFRKTLVGAYMDDVPVLLELRQERARAKSGQRR
jgi:hypothetical protein